MPPSNISGPSQPKIYLQDWVDTRLQMLCKKKLDLNEAVVSPSAQELAEVARKLSDFTAGRTAIFLRGFDHILNTVHREGHALLYEQQLRKFLQDNGLWRVGELIASIEKFPHLATIKAANDLLKLLVVVTGNPFFCRPFAPYMQLGKVTQTGLDGLFPQIPQRYPLLDKLTSPPIPIIKDRYSASIQLANRNANIPSHLTASVIATSYGSIIGFMGTTLTQGAFSKIRAFLSHDLSSNQNSLYLARVSHMYRPRNKRVYATNVAQYDNERQALKDTKSDLDPLFSYHDEKSRIYDIIPVKDGNLSYLMNMFVPNADLIRQVTLSVLKDLRKLHDAKYIHMDIKPDNILWDRDGNFVLADYGLAQKAGSLRRSVGTLSFGAPEAWTVNNLGPITEYADIYSVGITLLKMMAKKDNETIPLLRIGWPTVQQNKEELQSSMSSDVISTKVSEDEPLDRTISNGQQSHQLSVTQLAEKQPELFQFHQKIENIRSLGTQQTISESQLRLLEQDLSKLIDELAREHIKKGQNETLDAFFADPNNFVEYTSHLQRITDNVSPTPTKKEVVPATAGIQVASGDLSEFAELKKDTTAIPSAFIAEAINFLLNYQEESKKSEQILIGSDANSASKPDRSKATKMVVQALLHLKHQKEKTPQVVQPLPSHDLQNDKKKPSSSQHKAEEPSLLIAQQERYDSLLAAASRRLSFWFMVSDFFPAPLAAEAESAVQSLDSIEVIFRQSQQDWVFQLEQSDPIGEAYQDASRQYKKWYLSRCENKYLSIDKVRAHLAEKDPHDLAVMAVASVDPKMVHVIFDRMIQIDPKKRGSSAELLQYLEDTKMIAHIDYVALKKNLIKASQANPFSKELQAHAQQLEAVSAAYLTKRPQAKRDRDEAMETPAILGIHAGKHARLE